MTKKIKDKFLSYFKPQEQDNIKFYDIVYSKQLSIVSISIDMSG